MTKDDRVTLNLKIQRKTKEALERLRDDSTGLRTDGGKDSLTSTLQKAIALYRRYVDTVSANGELLEKSADGEVTRLDYLH